MREQGTTYIYDYMAVPRRSFASYLFLGNKPLSILREAARWPMLFDTPDGFSNNAADPPPDAVPHSGGLNVAYGDGHAKYHHIEAADGYCSMVPHIGDGIYQ